MQSPSCANCVRRNEYCEYPMIDAALPSEWTSEIPILGNQAIGASSSAGRSSGSNSPYTLMPEAPAYAGPTAGTIETTLSFQSPLHDRLTSLFGNSWFSPVEIHFLVPMVHNAAQKYPYVSHSLQSLSVLVDEFYGSPGRKPCRTPVAAYQHHITASSLFRQTPPVIDENSGYCLRRVSSTR